MKMLVSEIKLREMIRSRLLSEITDADLTGKYEYEHRNDPIMQMKVPDSALNKELVDKKFSLTDGGEPDFVVVADNITKGMSVIQKYSKSNKSLEDIKDGLIGAEIILPFDRLVEKRMDEMIETINKIIEKRDGWVITDAMVLKLTLYFNLDIDKTQFILITRDKRNFKKPTIISTASGQGAAASFECVLSLEDVVKNTFSWPPTTPEWEMAAACWYDYANSIKLNALGALIGAAVGTAIGPGVGTVGGLFVGLLLADMAPRLISLIWMIGNEKYAFAAANILVMALSLVGGKVTSGISAQLVRANAKRITVICGFLLDFLASFIPEVQIQGVRKEIEEMIKDPDRIDSFTSSPDGELLRHLRNKYPKY